MPSKERTADFSRIVWKSAAVLLFIIPLYCLIEASPPQREVGIIDFALHVEIYPEKSWLEADAKIELRSQQDGLNKIEFYLRPSLKVSSVRDEEGRELLFSQVGVESIFPNSDSSLVRVILGRRFSKGEKLKLTVSYAGLFLMSSGFNPKENRYNRAFSSITREAAWLRHVQLWYPYFPDQWMSFTVRAKVPAQWTVVTNGRLEDVFEDEEQRVFVYREDKLTSLDPILFGAPYVVATQEVENFQVTAYLFPEHELLIQPYLTKTVEIVGFFQEKFGPPAAETFSVLEIGTGYGTGTSAPFGYAIASHLISLDDGERVQKIVVDPDFQILGVREVLEDRWKARDLRMAALESDNFEEFEPRLTSLNKKHSDNIPILHEVAQFYAAQEEWNKAIEVYRRILDREPGEFAFIALANIAGAYEKMGDKQNEKLYLEKALARGSSMYSIMRSLMDKLEKLKE